jgi:hypothetical protein
MYATVTWNRSNSPRVSGYLLTAQFGAEQISMSAASSAGRLDYSTGRLWSAYQIPVTVTTLTDYGWTTSSAPVMVTTC